MRLRLPLVVLVATAALATAGGTLTACGDPLADTQQDQDDDEGDDQEDEDDD